LTQAKRAKALNMGNATEKVVEVVKKVLS